MRLAGKNQPEAISPSVRIEFFAISAVPDVTLAKQLLQIPPWQE
jgi:hypothetical protein